MTRPAYGSASRSGYGVSTTFSGIVERWCASRVLSEGRRRTTARRSPSSSTGNRRAPTRGSVKAANAHFSVPPTLPLTLTLPTHNGPDLTPQRWSNARASDVGPKETNLRYHMHAQTSAPPPHRRRSRWVLFFAPRSPQIYSTDSAQSWSLSGFLNWFKSSERNELDEDEEDDEEDEEMSLPTTNPAALALTERGHAVSLRDTYSQQ